MYNSCHLLNFTASPGSSSSGPSPPPAPHCRVVWFLLFFPVFLTAFSSHSFLQPPLLFPLMSFFFHLTYSFLCTHISVSFLHPVCQTTSCHLHNSIFPIQPPVSLKTSCLPHNLLSSILPPVYSPLRPLSLLTTFSSLPHLALLPPWFPHNVLMVASTPQSPPHPCLPPPDIPPTLSLPHTASFPTPPLLWSKPSDSVFVVARKSLMGRTW